MPKKYIIAIDQGTTSSRVIVVDREGDVKHIEQMAVTINETRLGEILQDPQEIIDSVLVLLDRTFKRHQIKPDEVAAIGITNQRETTILWDKHTGKSLYHAISWQSKHTNNIIEEWIEKGYQDIISAKTGLTISPYFSASKIKYILDIVNVNVSDILFGTVDTYLLWHLTNRKVHKTDITNASRTMLYNIFEQQWDDELLRLLQIPKSILPKVVANDDYFGEFTYQGISIPIYSMIGDQQSSLFGHQCFNEGDLKTTYGTGCFILVNTSFKPVISKSGLLTTPAWKINNQMTYALEGSVFMGGAIVQWLRDDLKILNSAQESESLAEKSIRDDVYVVPAFVGLGTPYWNSDVRASILGMNRKTGRNDIIKAALNSIAFQIEDVLQVLKKEFSNKINTISCDGGASRNNYLLQFQADISNMRVVQTKEAEVTALGSAYIAGLRVGFWKNIQEIERNKKIKQLFYSRLPNRERERLYLNWKKAVTATLSFQPQK